MQIIELGGGGRFNFISIMGIRVKPGANADAFLKSMADLRGASVQLLDADLVAGKEHLVTAALLAAKSWGAGEAVAKSPSTEVLLYASGERQIKEAIRKLGAKPNSASWCAIAVAEQRRDLEEAHQRMAEFGDEDDRLVEISARKKNALISAFSISTAELSLAEGLVGTEEIALKSLVLEKTALSDLYR